MSKVMTLVSAALVAFFLGAGSGLLWAVTQTPPSKPSDPKNMSVSVHSAHPTLVWTAGGLSQTHPYYRETAWIRVRFLDADWTFFLDQKDLKQLVSYVKAGACPDICDDAGNPTDFKKRRIKQ